MQKIIEILTEPEQIAVVIQALAPGVVLLIKDLNGNHVVQRCLQEFSADDAQFIYDAAKSACVEIATHRHGCCVLQARLCYPSFGLEDPACLCWRRVIRQGARFR